MKPLAIDLFCGLGGFSEGLIAEGWNCIGFDIERHDYGEGCYPGELVLQDVLTIGGAQFRDASLIVASPPCPEFSYMSMPFSRGKQIAAALRGRDEFPPGYTGSRTVRELTTLFDACFRIQREASAAAGRYIPMVVENVKGAQLWVGSAKGRYGSFYLWGDVGMVNGRLTAGALRFGNTLNSSMTPKISGQDWSRFNKTGEVSPHWNMQATKNNGGSWFNVANNTTSGTGQRPVNGVKCGGSSVKHGGDLFSDPDSPGRQGGSTKGFVTGLGKGHDWRQDPSARFNSKSKARKAASAQIAKIPFPLSSYIGRVFRPEPQERAS